MDDRFGAFCPGPRVAVAGAAAGPLAGLAFAAKDNFDVAGHVTGAGNPDWARSHAPAPRTAAAVSLLLAAGANLAGKTQMDELAYGVVGENAHHGTPINPAAPDRVPGGSSSGSAVAVAGGLVDFALGSDSACSVRLPAAVCGIFGLRPTHGRVPVDGLVPLSPSLDTVGWFARDPEVLRRVGRVLLTATVASPPPGTLLVAGDAFALASPAVARALEPAIAAVREQVPAVESMRLVAAGVEIGLDQFWFRVWSVQVREVWTIHGDWIMRARPESRVLTRDNLTVGAASTPAEEAAARGVWQELVAKHPRSGRASDAKSALGDLAPAKR